MRAETIDDVLYNLDLLIESAREERNRIAYFACLYRHVTYAVKEGVARNVFEHGQRIADLDVHFANRYFEALDYWRRGELAVQAWKMAFDAAQRPDRIVMQHLFLGMNAHINLDLAIATARTFPGDEIATVQHDFNTMNNVLGSLVHHVENDLSRIWPILRVVHAISRGVDDRLLSFDIDLERARAWGTAQRLAHMTFEQQEAEIRRLDDQVARGGQWVMNPRFPVDVVIAVFRWLQHDSVRKTIDILSDGRLRQYLYEDRAAEEAARNALDSDRPATAPH
jgi:hypothetical protein